MNFTKTLSPKSFALHGLWKRFNALQEGSLINWRLILLVAACLLRFFWMSLIFRWGNPGNRFFLDSLTLQLKVKKIKLKIGKTKNWKVKNKNGQWSLLGFQIFKKIILFRLEHQRTLIKNIWRQMTKLWMLKHDKQFWFIILSETRKKIQPSNWRFDDCCEKHTKTGKRETTVTTENWL